MTPQNLTSLNEINSNRVINIEFSDATYLKEFDYSGRVLTLNFIINDTETTNVSNSYENHYSLNVFNIKGRVSQVKINMQNEGPTMQT